MLSLYKYAGPHRKNMLPVYIIKSDTMLLIWYCHGVVLLHVKTNYVNKLWSFTLDSKSHIETSHVCICFHRMGRNGGQSLISAGGKREEGSSVSSGSSDETESFISGWRSQTLRQVFKALVSGLNTAVQTSIYRKVGYH